MIEEKQEIVEEPKKRHTGLIVFIVLIAGVLIGAGGCYYYFNYMVKDDNKVKTEVKKDNLDEENLDVDIVFVKDLISRYDSYVMGSDEVFDNIYTKDIKSVSSIEENTRMAMAYQNMNVGTNSSFSSADLAISYTKLFGPENTLSNKDFTYGCGSFKYDSKERVYTYNPIAGCGGGPSNGSLLRKITEAKVKEGNVLITVAVGIKKPKDDGSNDNAIYNRLGVIEGLDANSFDIDKDYKKLDKVQYKFAYDEKNRNYYLVSIKKIGL